MSGLKMEDRHTPGPWLRLDVSTGSATKREQLTRDGRAAMLLIHDGSREGEANAALIAAAPDLLAALRLLKNVVSQGGDLSSSADRRQAWVCDVGAAMRAARAALAKAEGGAA